MDGSDIQPRLYTDLADWWPLLSAPSDYADEAAGYERTLLEAADGEVRDVLELGSGGGNNASHLKRRFRLTLVDRSPAMLAVSRALNPECEHVEGDMRTIRLGRTFDAVFVHDAIAYMTTEVDLRATFATAFAHCRPGGAALFCPDHVRDTFRPRTDHGGHDGSEGRALRYLDWAFDPDPSDDTYVSHMVYLLRDPDGRIEVAHDVHECGLFPRATWLELLADVGFVPRVRAAGHGEEVGAEEFLGVRPA